MEGRQVDEFGANLEEIAHTVERAKVLDIQFELLGESLLIDFRAAGTDRPLAMILPKASSRRERMRSVKALRPNAPVPERIAGFSWQRHVTALHEAGRGADSGGGIRAGRCAARATVGACRA